MSLPFRTHCLATIDDVLDSHRAAGIVATEGHATRNQMEWLQDVVIKSKCNTVFEIGFNAGHSAAAFLSGSLVPFVVSMDLGAHDYVVPAKNWIDKTFPGRHLLLVGDSVSNLPTMLKVMKGFSPDLIFLDGGHDAPIPAKDLECCLRLARPDTLIVIDDVVPHHTGVMSAINDALKAHTLHLIASYKEGDVRGWAVFKKVG